MLTRSRYRGRSVNFARDLERRLGLVDEPTDKSLARLESTAAADAFEREYMQGEGMVLYRDKMVAGRKMNLFLAAVGALLVASAVTSGSVAPVVVGLPLLAVFWVLFGVLRVGVSEGAVTIKYGLIGPTIPLESIESAIAIDYNWAVFGGWGIRRGPEGWMYNMMGDGGRAVKIVWHDSAGKRRVHYVGTRTADELSAAINRARLVLPAASERKAIED